jgi:triacylglycerol lipase
MIKDLTFAEQSALFARLSNLAYEKPSDAQKLFKKAGFDQSVFYSNDGSNAYVIETKDDIVVVCRGTEVKEWDDIKADLSIALVPSRTGNGRVHRGFRTYTDKVWEPIKSHLKQSRDKMMWFTGHSLGAAMATLMVRRCILDKDLSTPVALFTYGSPRVGDRTYIDEFNHLITHHRWVNDGDIVTKSPLPPLYYHCGVMHHIDKSGKVTVNFDRKISWSRVLSLLLPHGLIKLIMGDAQDHSSVGYTEKLTYWSMTDTESI